MMKFFKDESGQGMVEYGLILALIAVAAIAILTGLGKKVNGIFKAADGALTSAGAIEAQ